MLEKYDGIRVFWDGATLRCAKNTKISIEVPKELSFPNVPFEGELWYTFCVVCSKILGLALATKINV
jgi:hypothetical protein